MADKSYNSRALKGDDNYDDVQFQTDMRELGITIPDDVLFTPRLNDVVLDQVHAKAVIGLQERVNPLTGTNYTEEEAKEAADNRRKQKKSELDALSK